MYSSAMQTLSGSPFNLSDLVSAPASQQSLQLNTPLNSDLTHRSTAPAAAQLQEAGSAGGDATTVDPASEVLLVGDSRPRRNTDEDDSLS